MRHGISVQKATQHMAGKPRALRTELETLVVRRMNGILQGREQTLAIDKDEDLASFRLMQEGQKGPELQVISDVEPVEVVVSPRFGERKSK